MRLLLAGGILFIGLAWASVARAQYYIGTVTAASVSGGPYSPGATISVPFTLAPGTTAASRVDFYFAANGIQNELTLSSTNPAGGIATGLVGQDWQGGTYTLTGIRVTDALGDYIDYNSTGVADVIDYHAWYLPASAAQVSYAGLSFTVTNSYVPVVPVPPTLANVAFASTSVTAGNPINLGFMVQPGTDPAWSVLVMLKGPGEQFWSQTASGTGAGAGTVSFPTDATWMNASYSIADVFVSGGMSSTVYFPGDGTGVLASGSACALTGGLDPAQVVWPTVTGITVPPGPFSPGQTVNVNVAITPGSAPIASVKMTFQSPDATIQGVGPTTTANGSGALVFTVGPDWTDGTYAMTEIDVTDTDGRILAVTPGGPYFEERTGIASTPVAFSATTSFSVAGAVAYPTAITTQPQGGTVQPGQSLTLNLTLAGAQPNSIQWYVGQPGDTSQPIPYATNSSYEPTPPSSTTTYWAQITSGSTVTNSAGATIAVNYPSPQPTIITTDGSSSSIDIDVGNGGDLSVFAVGPGPLTYTWYKDGTVVPGATTGTLNFATGQLSDNGNYTLVIANAYGSVTAGPFSVTFHAPPQITVQPTSQTAAYGGSVTFSVTATGGDLGYTWSASNTAGGTPSFSYSQIESPNFTIDNLQPDDAGTYTVNIRNIDGQVTSVPVTLTVTGDPVPQFSAVADQYGQVNVSFGAAFLANNYPTQYAATGLPPGLAIDATSGAINGTPTTAGVYSATISATNAGGTSSVAVNFTIAAGNYGPIFTQQPSSLTVAVGEQVTLNAAAVGTPAGFYGLGYQWYLGSTLVQNYGPNYTFTASAATAGSYTVQVSGAGGTVTSAPAVVTVDTTLSVPGIGAAVPDQTVAAGSSITLSFPITGSGPMTYQWTGPAFVPGPTTATWTIPAASVSNNGQYSLRVTNPYGQGTFTQTLYVQYAAQPAAVTVYPGQTATLSVPAAAGAQFQWYEGAGGDTSSPVAGATQATFTTPPLTSSTSYWVWVSSASVGSSLSSASVITVNASLASYAGTYFGTLAGGGWWAMVVGSDGAGEFLGYAGPNEASFGAVTIDGNGNFVAAQSQAVAAGAGTARAITAPVVTGSISAGSVTGTFSGVALIGSADQGSNGALAPGLVAAAGLNGSSASGYAIVGPDGKAAIVVDTGSGVVGAIGLANSSGVVSGTDATGDQITAQPAGGGGSLAIDVTASNGNTLSLAGLLPGGSSTARLLNLSARENVGTGADIGAIGFVVGGTGTMNALIRGVGPSLAEFGVSGFLAQPALTVFDRNSNPLWVIPTADAGDATADVARAVGAFALQSDTTDAADVISLAPGQYTAQLSGVGGTSGVGLAELYQSTLTGSPRLLNLSARGSTGPGAGVLTAGLVVGGNAPETVLLRGIGPALANFGVPGALSDPVLVLYDGSQHELMSNSGWGGSVGLQDAFNTVGAFMLPTTSADAAMLVTLLPGSYTVQVQSQSGSTGVALVEVYEMPAN